MESTGLRRFFVIGPGLLVAATGVGAGDLATAALTGGRLGTAVLWAVAVGAFLKFVLNEGLARWQLATGRTLLEGAVDRFGRVFAVVFLPYFVIWSFFVALALVNACGVTLHAMIPVFDDAARAKQIFGPVQAVIALGLVLGGGFRLFEKVMSVCIGIMFVTVVVTAGLLWPGAAAVGSGLLFPHPDTLRDESLTWTVALMGGVGGTVSILCYGYWIREKGWVGKGDLSRCRIDLGIAYFMTAIFGVGMVIIGSTVPSTGGGAGLIVSLAERLEEPVGAVGKWLFIVGAWAAVFSSLLGVWQAIPYLFADLWGLLRHRFRRTSAPEPSVDTRSWPYRIFLFALALGPLGWLDETFERAQVLYAVCGALFIPLLALALLVLNGNRSWVGADFRNRAATVAVLVLTLLFFAGIAWIRLS